jgi:hypothetical protein
MAAITQSTVPGILKELYDGQKTMWLTYSDNPLLAMFDKQTKFSGKFYPNSVVYGLSQGASATFANAYANQNSPQVAEFLMTRVSDFSLATIDGQLLAAATTDPGAFLDGSELMIDAAWQTAVNRLASAMFRNGAGTIGQISSVSHVSGAGPYITQIVLSNPDDSVQFEVGQALNDVQNVDGSGSTSILASPQVVISVNRNTGVLQTTSAVDGSTDFTANYYLAVQGDLPSTANNNFQPSGSTTTNSLLKLAGLQAWLPMTAPGGSDSFFGVNRSADVQRLSGVNSNQTGVSIEEGLLFGTGQIALQGGKVDTGVCSYATYTSLITSLGSKVVYVDEKIGEIGFRGVQVNGANTVMSVFPDRSCPDGWVFALEMDDWTLRSQNEAPHILKYLDQIEILRVQGQDSAELRVGGYMQMYPKHPGHHGAIQVQLNEF